MGRLKNCELQLNETGNLHMKCTKEIKVNYATKKGRQHQTIGTDEIISRWVQETYQQTKNKIWK